MFDQKRLLLSVKCIDLATYLIVVYYKMFCHLLEVLLKQRWEIAKTTKNQHHLMFLPKVDEAICVRYIFRDNTNLYTLKKSFSHISPKILRAYVAYNPALFVFRMIKISFLGYTQITVIWIKFRLILFRVWRKNFKFSDKLQVCST